MPESIAAFLQSTDLFRPLPADTLQPLAARLEQRRLPDGSLLFAEGDPSQDFYLIQSGQVEIVKAAGAPEETLLGRRGPGEFIGEMGLLNPDGLRTAAARVVGPACLVVIPYAELTALLGRHPSLAYQLAQVLSSRMTAEQTLNIQRLHEKNLRLQQAYDELKAAQAQLVEKEKLERELQLAREIQESILPTRLPRLPGYDCGARMLPARAVGGDFFDLFMLKDGRLALVVGDVTDKGIPAAIFMAQTHALLRATAGAELSPRQTLEKTNHFLLQMNQSGLFATVIYGLLTPATGEFTYARAGHELPLLLDPAGQFTYPPAGAGMPLGILPHPALDCGTLTLPPGSLLLLYSDGVTDIPGLAPEDTPTPTNLLENTLAQLAAQLPAEQPAELTAEQPAGLPAQALCQAILHAVLSAQPGGQFDDITLLAVRRAPAA